MAQLSLENIKSQLRRAGFKLTPQREATANVLLDNQQNHLSAEEVFMCLKQTHPDIGLATVYRTLEILTQLNVTKKVVFEDGLARYDLGRSNQTHFHHHLLCTYCGKIEEVFEDLLTDIEKGIEMKYKFKVQDHRLTFHGICQNCQKVEKEGFQYG